MFKVVEILLAVTFLWWLGFIFIAGDPNIRIERTCEPVSSVFGRLAGSVADLAHSDSADDVREWFSEANYSCRYMVWNQFYGEDWRKNAHDAPVTQRAAPKSMPPSVRIGIDGKPLPPLPGEPDLPITPVPLPGELPKVEPLPPGMVAPPLKAEPAVRSVRDIPPPVEPKSQRGGNVPLEDIKLPEKRPPNVPPNQSQQ